MQKPELLLGSLLGCVLDYGRQLVQSELFSRLTRCHREFTMHEINNAELVLHEEQLLDRNATVVNLTAKAVANEQPHVAKCASIEVALMHLVVEV